MLLTLIILFVVFGLLMYFFPGVANAFKTIPRIIISLMCGIVVFAVVSNIWGIGPLLAPILGIGCSIYVFVKLNGLKEIDKAIDSSSNNKPPR